MTTVHLISVGDVAGITVEELKPGMRIMWNYGAISQVISAVDCSAKFMSIKTKSLNKSDFGTEYEFRRKKTAAIVAYWPESKYSCHDCKFTTHEVDAAIYHEQANRHEVS